MQRKTTFRSSLKALVEKTGFTIFPPGKLPVGSDYRRAIDRSGIPVRTVVDVGANVGQFSLHCSQYFKSATIVAFEPVKATYEVLRTNTAHVPNIECVHSACSSDSGEARMFLHAQSVVNSLDPKRNVQTHPGQAHETVSVIRLDEYCEMHGIEFIDLLKIDAEGHDRDVLLGARRLIDSANIKMVLVEVAFDPDQSGVSQYTEVASPLLTAGYRLSGLYNQTTRGADQRLAFADALFTLQTGMQASRD